MSERAEEIFEHVSDLPPSERAAGLDAACGGDPALRAEVLAMLEMLDHESVRFLENAPPTTDNLASPPATIGRYRIVRRLGEGSSGTVFEAEQRDPTRRVALKLLRTAVASEAESARFRFEGEILARLHHRGIAQIYEIGVFDGGLERQPFLAMELVEGQRLDEYVARHGLSIRARIELVLAICSAVSHAHQIGVIHRDLKPANVLVTPDGEPKLLDFGIARVIDPTAVALTMPTMAGPTGTLPYMSPEQVLRDGRAVDTRADLYALGVITYQLLCGRLPLEVSLRSLPEAARLITEVEPPPLGKQDPALGGDLSTVVATAMAKEPVRRYQTVAAFADDLQRLLAHRPILARPATVWYLARKLARRHRVGVALGAAALVAIVAGVVGTLRFALEARAQARLASSRAQQSERRLGLARDSLDFLFDEVIETLPRFVGTSGLLERILERGTTYYTALANEAPEDLAERRKIWRAFERLAQVYIRRGELRRGLAVARRFRDMVNASAPELDPATRLIDTFHCELTLYRLGQPDAGERAHRLVGPLLAARPDDPDVLLDVIAMLVHGQAGTGSPDFNRAEQLCDRLLQLRPTDPDAIAVRCVLDDHRGNRLISEGHLEAARSLQERTAARLLGLHSRATADPRLLNNLAICRAKLASTERDPGDTEAARRHVRQSVADARNLVALEPATPTFRATLADALLATASIEPGGPAHHFELLQEAFELLLPLASKTHWGEVCLQALEQAADPGLAAGHGTAFESMVARICARARAGEVSTEAIRTVLEDSPTALTEPPDWRSRLAATLGDELPAEDDGSAGIARDVATRRH